MGYDSYYEIVDPASFSEIVAQNIAGQLIKNGELTDFGRFRVWKFYGKVKYSQSKHVKYEDFKEAGAIKDAFFFKKRNVFVRPARQVR